MESETWTCRVCKQEVNSEECEQPTSHGVRCNACGAAAREKRKAQNRNASKKRRDTLLGDTETHRVCDICGFSQKKVMFHKDKRGRSVTCLRCEPEKERRRLEKVNAVEKGKWLKEEKMKEARRERARLRAEASRIWHEKQDNPLKGEKQ